MNPVRNRRAQRARRPNRPAIFALIAALAGLAVSTLPARPAVAATGRAATVVSPAGLARLSSSVASVAATNRAGFGGVYINPRTRTVHVQVAGNNLHALAATLDRHGLESRQIVIQRVPRSLRQLNTDADGLLADRASLRAQGIRLDKVAVNEATNGLEVGVAPGTTRSALTLLRTRWPGLPVQVQYIRVLAASGTAEYQPGPPWVSGMELYKLFYQDGSLYYTACTAGFNVIDPATGRTYLTTASHCFNPGDTILHSEGNVGQTVGTVTNSAGYGSTADTELIAPTDPDTPNTILVNNSTELSVTGYLPVTDVGTSVCKSGSATGETCGNVVESSDATVCYSSGCFYNQEETVNTSQAEVAYYGDSGGPVYLYNSTGAVTAAGNVSGFEETCNAAGGDCALNGVMFFTPISNMKQTLDVVP